MPHRPSSYNPFEASFCTKEVFSILGDQKTISAGVLQKLSHTCLNENGSITILCPKRNPNTYRAYIVVYVPLDFAFSILRVRTSVLQNSRGSKVFSSGGILASLQLHTLFLLSNHTHTRSDTDRELSDKQKCAAYDFKFFLSC